MNIWEELAALGYYDYRQQVTRSMGKDGSTPRPCRAAVGAGNRG
jgi:hypothetical protein